MPFTGESERKKKGDDIEHAARLDVGIGRRFDLGVQYVPGTATFAMVKMKNAATCPNVRATTFP